MSWLLETLVQCEILGARIISDHVFLKFMPRNGIVKPYGSQLEFLVELHLFSIMAELIYVPANSVGGFPSERTSLKCL